MGNTPTNKRKHRSSANYYINDDGSVTKKASTISRTQVSSFVINEDGSVTKNFSADNCATNFKSKINKKNLVTKSTKNKITTYSIGIAIHILATVLFLILMVVNTTDTLGGYVEACLGLSLFSVFMYYVITRPILNWINRL